MSGDEIHQPHDRFFKQIFGRLETTAAFALAYLPGWLAPADWARLELMPGSFVDARLRHQESDLLFRVPFRGQPLYLYLLFEHQRTVDPWMALRALGYQVHIWQDLLEAEPKLTRLPPILALVLYQGARGWNVPVRFADLLTLPEAIAPDLRRCQPDSEYLLVDLSRLHTEEIRGDLIGRLALSLMKAVAEERLAEWLEEAGPLLAELLRREDVPGIVETLLRYLLAADSSMSVEMVRQSVERSQTAEMRGKFMSIAEQLKQEGREEGRQEGALIGQIQTLQELLALPVSPVRELADTPVEELKRLGQELRNRLAARSAR